MITNFKLFENKTYGGYVGKYWLVPTDDRFMSALKKIKCNDPLFTEYDQSNKGEYIYMTYKYNLGWSYMNYDKFSIEWYEDYNYKYMGAVNIYDGELQMNKYNL
jgi:hypothetical protein